MASKKETIALRGPFGTATIEVAPGVVAVAVPHLGYFRDARAVDQFGRRIFEKA